MFPGNCPQEQKDTYLHDQIIYIAQAQWYIIKKSYQLFLYELIELSVNKK